MLFFMTMLVASAVAADAVSTGVIDPSTGFAGVGAVGIIAYQLHRIVTEGIKHHHILTFDTETLHAIRAMLVENQKRRTPAKEEVK